MLAQELVERFHGAVAAKEALEEFEARFRRGVLPDDLPEVHLHVGAEGAALVQVLKHAGLTSSTSEAIRMLGQGAIRLNGERVENRDLVLHSGQTVVLQVGKRKFASVVLG
jgi:tyrosyl-tRNA synthetase